MLSPTIPKEKPASPFVRYVLQATNGKYFEQFPAFPSLTKNRKQAREFADEILADAFRELIEIRCGLSFTTFAVLGRS